MSSTVYVVHAIDTEGPLYESLAATMQRVKEVCGVSLQPTLDNLQRLQRQELDLNGYEESVATTFSEHLLKYNDTWDKITNMLSNIQSPDFRSSYPDSYCNPWQYHWFCVDHVGYDTNPRRRTLGYHQIYDFYNDRINLLPENSLDSLHFHFHPHSPTKAANHSATHWWANSNSLFQILSRRIIDRGWFPSAHRAGFHVTRPDSHWFLEQFIPFDLSNQAQRVPSFEHPDLAQHRFGDWSRAPLTWSPYHPAHDDYQSIGSCNRFIARCLNVGTRFRLLNEEDVLSAFAQADRGQPVILSFTNHDFRDMAPDVAYVFNLLRKASARFPSVGFRYSDPISAFRCALNLPTSEPCRFDFTWESMTNRNVLRITSTVPTFGPQPYLALKTVSGTYLYDNLDIILPQREWSFTFDHHTLPLSAIETIGIAANNSIGATTILRIYPSSMTFDQAHHNV